jgi:hypothetical protein
MIVMRGRFPPWIARLLGAAAVAGWFVGAFYARGLAPLRPHEHWPLLAIFAAAVGGLPLPFLVRIIPIGGLAAFAKNSVVPPGLLNAEDWEPWRVHFYASGLFFCLLALQFHSLYTRRPRALACLYVFTAIGGAGLLFWSGNALFAEMAGALAVAIFVVRLIGRSEFASCGAVAVAAVLHPALLAAGCFNNFSDVPTWTFAVVALVPLVGALPFAKPPGRG